MVKYLIKTLIISIIFFTNSVKAERLDKLKFHNVLEEFGNPFYSAELSQANSTKFIWYDKVDYNYTIVCIVAARGKSVCSVDGNTEKDNWFFDKYR